MNFNTVNVGKIVLYFDDVLETDWNLWSETYSDLSLIVQLCEFVFVC